MEESNWILEYYIFFYFTWLLDFNDISSHIGLFYA